VDAGVGERVERDVGQADLPVVEVLPVVVDLVGEPLLHPGRGGLVDPRVVLDVVGELHRVEELVSQRDLEVGQGRAVELLPGEVVVDHAVAGGDLLAARLVVLRGAEAVEAGRELLEVDVELRVAAVPAVGDRPSVAQLADLVVVDLVEHREGLLGPGIVGRGIGSGPHPVHAHLGLAALHRARRVAVAARVVGAVGGPREDPFGQHALVALEIRERLEQLTQDLGRVLVALHRDQRRRVDDPERLRQDQPGRLADDLASVVAVGAVCGTRSLASGGRQGGNGGGQRQGGDSKRATHGAPHPRYGGGAAGADVGSASAGR
jgi:hypothetical protein